MISDNYNFVLRNDEKSYLKNGGIIKILRRLKGETKKLAVGDPQIILEISQALEAGAQGM